MNAFNYPENNITESNYNDVLTHLNQTSPDIIQGLQLETCDLQALLSQVSMELIDYVYQTSISFKSLRNSWT